MSKNVILAFEQVSKCFKLVPSGTQSILGTLTSLGRRTPVEADELWAVRDVSFNVHAGESVGLIGHNGCGKSTLLKLATRILRPTSGNIAITGRVSALLELGAGFHEDLTGRENIYLNGSVLGLSRQELDARFDEIVAFSELEKFIDQPVKHYSSGMYMRLGFSVAVHCDPDVLLVDEILAVGDQAFQKKCIDRIYDLKQSGVTIVMVSHHLETLRKLCSKLVWLDHGKIQAYGNAEEVASQYSAFMQARIRQQGGHEFVAQRHGTFDAEITKVCFLDQNGKESMEFRPNEVMVISMTYVAHQPIQKPEFGIAIFHGDTLLAGPNNLANKHDIDQIYGPGTVNYVIQSLPLQRGAYDVTVAIHDGEKPIAYDYHNRAYQFSIISTDSNQGQGLLELAATWQHQKLSSPGI